MPSFRWPRTYKQLMTQMKTASHCEPMYSSERKSTLWHMWEGNQPGIVVKQCDRKEELRDEHKYSVLARAMGMHSAETALYEDDGKAALAIQFIPGVTTRQYDVSYSRSHADIAYDMSRKFKLAHVGTAILGLVDAHEDNILFCPDPKRQKEYYMDEDFRNAEPYLIDTALGFASTQKDTSSFHYKMMEHEIMRQSVGLLFDFHLGILDLSTIEDEDLKKSLQKEMTKDKKGLLQAELPHDAYIECALAHKAQLQENRAMVEDQGFGADIPAVERRCDEIIAHLQLLKRMNKPI